MAIYKDANASLAHLSVLGVGIYSLLVDFGRLQSRALGVPVGGAADRTALTIGNTLLGNPPATPALEISLSGPTVRADAEVAGIVFGAPFDLHSSRQNLTTGKTFTLAAGEELHIGGTRQGVRAYFCVRGGFHGPRILDSYSALGPLHEGTPLICRSSRTNAHFLQEGLFERNDPALLRVVPGRQADWFTPEEVHAFHGPEFTVRPESDRMGLRLDGPRQPVPNRELLSEPVCIGTVQVTRDGQCLILGRDAQTIGGYPKIAQVISADLDKLAQLRPGTRLRFERVAHEVAERLFRQQQRELRDWVTRLRAAVGDDY